MAMSRNAFADEERELRGVVVRSFTPKSPEDYNAVVIHGEVYCRGCEPDDVAYPGLPIEAQQHWTALPICSKCGAEHAYMQIGPDISVASTPMTAMNDLEKLWNPAGDAEEPW